MPCANMYRPHVWLPALSTLMLTGCQQFWRDLGFTDVHFDADGTLEVANTQPACVPGPFGKPLFFNLTSAASKVESDLATMPFVCTYGNGNLIQPEIVQDVKNAQWDSA